MWSLESALPLVVRNLQPDTRQFNYHLALGGGVLNTGRSDKDVDLYLLPLDVDETPDTEGLVRYLDALWGPGESLLNPEYPATQSHYKHKRKYSINGARADVFIL